MQGFVVYILESTSSGRHYFGYTLDLTKRLSEHNAGLSKFTSRYTPWKIIYTETYSSRSEAMRREKYFKSFQGYCWLKDRHII